MIDLQTALALINLGGLVVAIIQLYRQRKDTEHLARVTHTLEQELHRLNVGLDQDIQRLYRARDAIKEIEKTELFILSLLGISDGQTVPELAISEYLKLSAELSTNVSELQGLARAINDNEFSKLVGSIKENLADAADLKHGGKFGRERIPYLQEISLKLHQRIAELIAETINNKK